MKLKLISLVAVVAMILAVSLPAFAKDGNNVPDIIADVASGRHDNCPTVFSLGFIVEKQVAGIPLLNMIPILNLSRNQTGVIGMTPMGDRFGKEGEAEILTRFIWNLD